MTNGNETPREIAQRVAQALTASLARGSSDQQVSTVSDSVVMTPTASNNAPTSPTTPPLPIQATTYVAMLPFAYTNSDVAQLFSPFGKIARVTILRDKQTRKSRGVAFVQFARAEDCAVAVAEMHETEVEGFRLRCSIVKDNGRSHEFQRKRKYTPTHTPDATIRCFECGEYGHFSYHCPLNVLGDRERPVPKKKLKKKKKGYDVHERRHYFNDDGVVNLLAPPADGEDEVSLTLLSYPSVPQDQSFETCGTRRRKRKAVGHYFSDESASDDEEL